MNIKFKYFLFFQFLIILDLSAQNSIKTDNFFRSKEEPVYSLSEVLDANKDIKALCINKSDLITPFYGKPCLLDSILQHHQDKFVKRIQSVENLYLNTYLPQNLIEVLAKNASIKRIMLKPSEDSYSSHELQQIYLLSEFKDLQYFEGADSSLLFIECLQQFNKLDTLVWLDKKLQNRYLGQLMNITTFIIDNYGDIKYKWWNNGIKRYIYTYHFPPQLKNIYTKKIPYKHFATRLTKCTKLEYLTDISGAVIYPGIESMHVTSGYFPPPIPSLKKLTLDPAPQYIPLNINLFSSLKSLIIPRGWRWSLGLNIPSSLYQLSNLEELYIWTNHVSDSIRFLKKLKHLSIHIERSNVNFLSDSIQNLSQLESLLLHQEQSGAYSLPSYIYTLTSLNTLDIKYYTLSDSIRFLKELKELTIMGRNETLPDSLVALKKLNSLDLSHFRMPEGKYPAQMYQLKNLHRLDLGYNGDYRKKRKLLINVRKLKHLKKLSYFEFSIRAIKNEIHYRRLYNTLPENCEVKLHHGYDTPTPFSRANFGIYTEYGWGQAAFSGIELLYYIDRKYTDSFVKKSKRFKQTTTTKDKSKSMWSYPNPFHFHTLSFAVEWNYLKNPDFLMGYRLGYNYSRVREPIAVQLDLIAYTDYNNTFDLRLAPRLAIVPIRTSLIYVSLYYSYKLPLIPNNEQYIVSRHTIGLSCRFSLDWNNSFGYGFGM
jgi:hypothetical protein